MTDKQIQARVNKARGCSSGKINQVLCSYCTYSNFYADYGLKGHRGKFTMGCEYCGSAELGCVAAYKELSKNEPEAAKLLFASK